MKIETERLYLYPISDEKMRDLIESEKNLDMKQAYTEMLQGCLSSKADRMWSAVWYMELKEKPDVIVGDFAFKGLDETGILEIGYGLRDGYCGHGYMTEAVKAICSFALTCESVKKVEAETDSENVASQKVLERAGFIPNGIMGEEGPRYIFEGGI